MLGKKKCKILKEIRRRIAEENDIPYVTSQCNFQGACKGTCPKCEQELRELEEQLQRRQKLGKAVSISALTAGLLLSATGCPAQPIDEGYSYSEPQEASAIDGHTSPGFPDSAAIDGRFPGTENSDLPLLEGYMPMESTEAEDASECYAIAGMMPLVTEETMELLGDFSFND